MLRQAEQPFIDPERIAETTIIINIIIFNISYSIIISI